MTSARYVRGDIMTQETIHVHYVHPVKELRAPDPIAALRAPLKGALGVSATKILTLVVERVGKLKRVITILSGDPRVLKMPEWIRRQTAIGRVGFTKAARAAPCVDLMTMNVTLRWVGTCNLCILINIAAVGHAGGGRKNLGAVSEAATKLGIMVNKRIKVNIF